MLPVKERNILVNLKSTSSSNPIWYMYIIWSKIYTKEKRVEYQEEYVGQKVDEKIFPNLAPFYVEKGLDNGVSQKGPRRGGLEIDHVSDDVGLVGHSLGDQRIEVNSDVGLLGVRVLAAARHGFIQFLDDDLISVRGVVEEGSVDREDVFVLALAKIT